MQKETGSEGFRNLSKVISLSVEIASVLQSFLTHGALSIQCIVRALSPLIQSVDSFQFLYWSPWHPCKVNAWFSSFMNFLDFYSAFFSPLLTP